MARRAFKKHIKSCVSILTLSAMLTGGLISFLPAQEAVAVEKQANQVKRNVTYFGDWSIWGGEGNFYPKDIPADQLTHLNFAFLDFDENANLIFTDKDSAIGAPVGEPGVQWGGPNAGCINAFQELRAKNPNVKIGVSVGGWSKSGDFTEVTGNPTKRAKLIDNLVKYVEYANMDFVDLDWEYPSEAREPDKVDNHQDEGTPDAKPEDKENYVTFLEELRVALDKKGDEIGKYYEISVALPAPKSKVESGIDVERLFNAVDFANIMTYDMRGAWDETSGHQTGLYTNPLDPTSGAGLSVDESVNYFLEQGAPSEKIVVGAAYYTRGWDQVAPGPDAKNPGLFGEAALTNKDADQTPSRGAVNAAPMKVGEAGRAGGVWSYRVIDELKTKIPGLKEYWDDVAKAPYLYSETTGEFFTYDNVKSIEEKTKYVNTNDLGGMISWMASQDAPTSGSGTVRNELTTATADGLYGGQELPDHEIVYADLDIEATIKPVGSQWGGAGGGYEVTIKNNEKLGETDQVLKELERSAETIKTPIIYVDSDVKLTAGDHMAGVISTDDKGRTVIDIKGVWEGKNIEPGQSYKFMLNAEGDMPEDLSAITSVSVGQRMNEAGTVVAEQVVYGEDTPGPGPGPSENTAPTFTGVTGKTITVGDSFNSLAGVKANDKEDGDLTSKIKVSGKVDTNKAGTYKLNYSVTDSKGLETTKTRTIIVKDKEITPPPAENTAPVLKGIKDAEIKVGDKFEPMTGITANDKEDGDLTSKIKIAGTVDTDKVGKFTLTYSVTDSEGLKTEAKRVITVSKDDAEIPDGDTFDSSKVYNTGDTVVYGGKTYTAKWWTQGETPGISAVWEVKAATNPDGTEQYVPGKSYNGGAVVSHNGQKYEAKWWTNTTPGSDDSWKTV
ncbi:glycosyl hydrolase family 18 protein [uncultured Clostridium sp.]|uniref:glycosyl hydrolase family 18 protein n=1 Tax=uncultured Clostridium sp. TaxID=59620 RepID=UPI0026027A34|nr:glycosyl hydrolase family 18 protein [uncultured Clostridium sp.]